MSRCAEAGRGHSQTANPSWPMEIFHTIDMLRSLLMGVGQGTGICSSLFHEFKSSLVWEFEIFQKFGLFQQFHKICDCDVLRSLLRDWL